MTRMQRCLNVRLVDYDAFQGGQRVGEQGPWGTKSSRARLATVAWGKVIVASARTLREGGGGGK